MVTELSVAREAISTICSILLGKLSHEMSPLSNKNSQWPKFDWLSSANPSLSPSELGSTLARGSSTDMSLEETECSDIIEDNQLGNKSMVDSSDG